MMDRREAGFTLLEMTIVTVVSIPILLAVLSTSERVGKTVNAVDRNAEASETVARVAERIGRLVRSAHRSTFMVRATAADVKKKMASTVGDWMTAQELDPRSNIQFQSAVGSLSMNASRLTSVRELEFVLDAGESANGIDDDGDGLVDEGKLYLRYESTRTPIAAGVESCSFELDGQVIRFSMQCGRRDSVGQVYRVVVEQVWWVRNP